MFSFTGIISRGFLQRLSTPAGIITARIWRHNEQMNPLKVELIHERPREMFKSFHFQNLQYSRRREPRQVFAPGLITEGVARIGVVSDIHHNTLSFLKALNIFGEIGVNVLFLLGAYSYIPASLHGQDPSGSGNLGKRLSA
jgi:hypothetical protein